MSLVFIVKDSNVMKIPKEEYGTEEIKAPDYIEIDNRTTLVRFKIPEGETIIGRKKDELVAVYRNRIYRLGIPDVTAGRYEPSEGRYGSFKLIRRGNDVFIEAAPNRTTNPTIVNGMTLEPSQRTRLLNKSKINFGAIEAYYLE